VETELQLALQSQAITGLQAQLTQMRENQEILLQKLGVLDTPPENGSPVEGRAVQPENYQPA
jgi:uncharacterized coiled-coil protein SlyX